MLLCISFIVFSKSLTFHTPSFSFYCPAFYWNLKWYIDSIFLFIQEFHEIFWMISLLLCLSNWLLVHIQEFFVVYIFLTLVILKLLLFWKLCWILLLYERLICLESYSHCSSAMYSKCPNLKKWGYLFSFSLWPVLWCSN